MIAEYRLRQECPQKGDATAPDDISNKVVKVIHSPQRSNKGQCPAKHRAEITEQQTKGKTASSHRIA
jgi:hypothetical protein